MIAMQIIVQKSHMNTRERRSDRCGDPTRQNRHSDFLLFTVRVITSFVGAGLY